MRIISTRGHEPVRLRLLAPAQARFRWRDGRHITPCSVVGSQEGRRAPHGMPSNVTSRYVVECQAGDIAGAVLLTRVSLGEFVYEFPVRVRPS